MVIRNLSITYSSAALLTLKRYDFPPEFSYFCDSVSKSSLHDSHENNFPCVELNSIYDNHKIIWVALLVLFFISVKRRCRTVMSSVYVMKNAFAQQRYSSFRNVFFWFRLHPPGYKPIQTLYEVVSAQGVWGTVYDSLSSTVYVMIKLHGFHPQAQDR